MVKIKIPKKPPKIPKIPKIPKTPKKPKKVSAGPKKKKKLTKKKKSGPGPKKKKKLSKKKVAGDRHPDVTSKASFGAPKKKDLGFVLEGMDDVVTGPHMGIGKKIGLGVAGTAGAAGAISAFAGGKESPIPRKRFGGRIYKRGGRVK